MLESINGVATRDMPLAYAEMLLLGDPGTNVEISVLRVRKPDPQKVTLTRGPVRLPGVTAKVMPDGVGLVQAPALGEGHVKEVAQQLESLQKQGAKKFILDLRNSGFGKPEDGIALADLFLEKGLVSYVEGQKIKRQDFNAEPATLFKGQPALVVLTNRGTANAAEIAAAALLDHKRAEVVGEKTYGDAAIRRPITMDDGSAVLLAVAKYYSPSGKAIQDTGVTPTVAVADSDPAAEVEEDPTAGQHAAPPTAPEPKKLEDDAVLKKALELLSKGKDAAAAGAAATTSTEPRALPERDKPLTIEKK
jgi:carboxyl-terminal processing protease